MGFLDLLFNSDLQFSLELDLCPASPAVCVWVCATVFPA